VKKVLMIAYAFPPMSYAGVFRPLRFVKYLPKQGWHPLVLTLKECPDLEIDSELLKQIPEEVKIFRTPTIDPIRWMWKRQKAKAQEKPPEAKIVLNKKKADKFIQRPPFRRKIKDMLIHMVSFPDHMIFWVPFAVIRGAIIILREKPDVIYSTSPPHTAHLSALILSWVFRRPWVADFRDAWGDADNLSDQCFNSQFLKKVVFFLERRIFSRASKVLMVTDCYRDMARDRFPNLKSDKIQTLTNGFDLTDVDDLKPYKQEKFTIVYTGNFYASRQPDLFLDGLRFWLDNYKKNDLANEIQILFVGSFSDELKEKIKERGLEDFVHFKGFLTKKEAMRYNLGAHMLLLIIGFNKGSEGILTSKIFDYFLCRKNILAIAPKGEAEKLIKKSKSGFVISEETPSEIADVLESQFLFYQENHTLYYCPDENIVRNYEASKLTQYLGQFFDEISRQN